MTLGIVIAPIVGAACIIREASREVSHQDPGYEIGIISLLERIGQPDSGNVLGE
jgi:hypothetical protein